MLFFPFCFLGFLPSGFIAYLIRERRREEKQVQMVIGVSKVTYWFATAFYDLLVCTYTQ